MLRLNVHRKFIWLLLSTLIIILTVFHTQNYSTQIYYYFNPDKSIYCYRLQSEDTLSDISQLHVRHGKSIFFHETSCRSHRNGKITILPRQACAVESAARMNPNFDIYLTFSSPGIFKFEGTESDRMLQRLLEYKNVKLVHLNYENYTKNTPLEELYSKGRIELSSYAQSHASDVLRYLTLYKYGGIYLDTDVVVIKSLEELKPNYAGIETYKNVAAGVISFDHKGIGHDHVLSCIMDLKYNFKENGWGDNGPGVITRMLRKLCGVQLGGEMVGKNCRNFTVYPENMFYPISFGDWEMYFNPDDIAKVFRKARDSYVLHVWNKVSEETKVPLGKQTAYTTFARQYCPTVYKECDTSF